MVLQHRKWAMEAGAAILFLLIACSFLLASEDLLDALAWMRGEAVTIEPVLSDIGEGAAGEIQTFRVRAINHTSRSIRMVGGTDRCDCTTRKDLPLTLQGGETQSFQVLAQFRGTPGRFQHSFFVFLDDGGKVKTVVARYQGRVTLTAK